MSSRLVSDRPPPAATGQRERGHAEPPRRRRLAPVRTWLGTKAWPAYGAAGITAAYGVLKAYWVFGGTALWSIAPLSPDLIEKVRAGTAPRWFEIADALSVVLAVAGVAFALATLHRRRWLPARWVSWLLWPLATLMVVFRGLLSIVGDLVQIAGGSSTHTTVWDVVLWAPLFLVWGLLWAATAMTYARRADDRAAIAVSLP